MEKEEEMHKDLISSFDTYKELCFENYIRIKVPF